MLAAVARRVAGSVDRIAGGAGVDGFVGLIYHRVGARTPSPVDLPAARFAEQLDVVSADTDLVALGDALAGRPGVVVTFDDGTADWPEVVLPILVERSAPAIFYVATDFVDAQRSFPDEGRPATWSGLREMMSTGLVTIGSHTHTHRVLADSDARTAAEELDRSIGLIEDQLGVRCEHFAYPKAVAPSPPAEVQVRRRFASAVLAGNRSNRPATDPYRLGRHAVTVADGLDDVRRKAAGGGRVEGWLREQRDALCSRRADAPPFKGFSSD